MDIEKEKIGKLIEQIQSGSNEAFEELYRLTSPKAYFVALQILKNEQDAEDILQETYIKVLEKIGGIDPSQSFMGWLYRVVSNKSKNLLKKRNVLAFESYEDETFEEIPDDGTTKTVTDTSVFTVSGFDSTKTGTQTVTVSYGQCSDTFEVEVQMSFWQWILKIFSFWQHILQIIITAF